MSTWYGVVKEGETWRFGSVWKGERHARRHAARLNDSLSFLGRHYVVQAVELPILIPERPAGYPEGTAGGWHLFIPEPDEHGVQEIPWPR